MKQKKKVAFVKNIFSSFDQHVLDFLGKQPVVLE